MQASEINRLQNMLTYEYALYSLGYENVAGIDEAGRGPLAGDVFAAAVIMPKGFMPEGLDDSKKLSEKKREALYEIITANAQAYAVGRATPAEIDEINILNATYLAMNRALNALSVTADYVLIDGNGIRGMETEHKCIIKGDSLSLSIAAASIIAKVSRDRYISKLDALYPRYGFASHKGYGTKAHTDAILEHGPCAIHRRSFLKKLYGEGKCVV